MTIAILGCLGLAGVGLACGVPPVHCVLRALAGAAALYVVASIAGRMILNIMVDAVIDNAVKKKKSRRGEGDSAI